MHTIHSFLLQRLFTIACLLTFGAFVYGQESGLAGSWQTKGSDLVIRVSFNPDGTGVLDGAPIKYSVSGAQLTVTDAGVTNNYSFRLNGDELIVSGGNLDAPLTFVRQANTGGFGKRRAGDQKQSAESPAKESGLTGRWQSSEATVQINDNGTLTINGAPFRYAVKGNIITLGNDEGVANLPFKLSGNTLQVEVDGRIVVYKRLGRDDVAESFGRNSGGNPSELLGKWCYMANVNASNGGRMSNRCFTLYQNGTYDYYSETSSSGQYGSTASQESDSGTWTVSGGTLTAQSRREGTQHFSLEKRNHPKTGDPMLVLDGDAYVTYNQRSPWP